MTDTINGQISAFIDDELMTEESELLVRRLCNDEELRQTSEEMRERIRDFDLIGN